MLTAGIASPTERRDSRLRYSTYCAWLGTEYLQPGAKEYAIDWGGSAIAWMGSYLATMLCYGRLGNSVCNRRLGSRIPRQDIAQRTASMILVRQSPARRISVRFTLASVPRWRA